MKLNKHLMEKQTKILLGLGAIIAAYLILKPKKAVAQTELVSLKKSPNDGSVIIDNNDGYIPKSPYMPEVIIQQDKAIELQILSLLQRSREQEERRKYLIAEANRPDNVGGAADISPDELKILQESSLKLNPWV
jgi:hypothetical protein